MQRKEFNAAELMEFYKVLSPHHSLTFSFQVTWGVAF